MESKERYNAARRAKYAVHPEIAWRNALKWRYGLTVVEWDRLYRAQNGLCAICKQPPMPNRRLVVDHDHTTGEVRGLLCRNCNSALGLASESPEMLVRMADYLLAARQLIPRPAGGT